MDQTAQQQILITVSADGRLQVQVQAIENKALILGYLDLARHALLQQQQPSGSPLLVARGSLPPNGIARG